MSNSELYSEYCVATYYGGAIRTLDFSSVKKPDNSYQINPLFPEGNAIRNEVRRPEHRG